MQVFVVRVGLVLSIAKLKALQPRLFSQMNNFLDDVHPKYLCAKLEMSALLTGTFIKLIP